MSCHDRFVESDTAAASSLSLAGKFNKNDNTRKLGLKNPYYMEAEKFWYSRFKNEEGHFRILQRFSDNSELLEGIDRFRLGIFEANPYTLYLPHHCDADAIFLLTHGK